MIIQNAIHTEDVTVRTFANGFTVIIQPLDYSPVAATTLGYRVGSIDEGPGTRGLSHFCEHMMFKGTHRFGTGYYWNTVQRNGGRANAFTSRDMTVYYSIVPVAGLREILGLEADRMLNCLMDKTDISFEKQVVLEEELLTSRDDPDGALNDALFRKAFEVHPYGHPIIGSSSDITDISPKSVSDFYHNYYKPSNAVLAIVGRIDPDETLGMVEDLFGTLPPGEVKRTVITPEPPQRSRRIIEIDHASPLSRGSLAFHVPGADHRDSRALSLLAIHLSAGRSSRFEELLINPGLALDISASTNTLMDPGLFSIHGMFRSIDDRDRAFRIVFDELNSITGNGLTEEWLTILKGRKSAWSRISDTEPSGRSRRFAIGELKYRDHLYYWRSAAEVDSIGNEDLIQVLEDHIQEEHATLAILRPDVTAAIGVSTSGHRDSEADDLSPPTILSPEDTIVPDELLVAPDCSISRGTEDLRLPNGLRLLLRRDTTFPVVSLAFSFPMGTDREPARLAGLSAVIAETMLFGTIEEDSIRFNQRVENLGSGLELSPANEYAAGGLTVLSGDLREALSAVADLLIKPAFRMDDIGSVVQESLADIKDWCRSPIGAAMNSFARLSTDPPDNAAVPSSETLNAIRRDDIIAHFTNCCRPGEAVISIVGNLSRDDTLGMVQDLFGGWKDPLEPLISPVPRSNASSSFSEQFRLKGREQVAVVMGTPAPPRNSIDTYAFTLLNGMLGDGIGSRLGRTIRDTAGLCYHVSSVYLPFLNRGRLAALLMTSPGASLRAITMLREQMAGLYRNPIGSDELRLELASHLGKLQLATTRYSSIARLLLTLASMKLPLNYDILTTGHLLELTPEDLRVAAEKWLGSSIRYTAVAGAISDELEKLI